jgi:hypothetical protein
VVLTLVALGAAMSFRVATMDNRLLRVMSAFLAISAATGIWLGDVGLVGRCGSLKGVGKRRAPMVSLNRTRNELDSAAPPTVAMWHHMARVLGRIRPLSEKRGCRHVLGRPCRKRSSVGDLAELERLRPLPAACYPASAPLAARIIAARYNVWALATTETPAGSVLGLAPSAARPRYWPRRSASIPRALPSGSSSTTAAKPNGWPKSKSCIPNCGPFPAFPRASAHRRIFDAPGEVARWDLGRGQLVIVDEARLAGTFALDEVVRAAAMTGAKVLLVGDQGRFGAVEAGECSLPW